MEVKDTNIAQSSQTPRHRQQPQDFSVEVLESEDLWAQFGPKLPDKLTIPEASKYADSRHRWFGIRTTGAVLTNELNRRAAGL